MNKKPPFVSIVILVFYNIEEARVCVDSVLKSDFTEFEIILVFNSPLEHEERRMFEALSGSIFIYILEQSGNSGAALGRNIGASMAQGKFILFLDSDNAVSPNLITILSNSLADNPSIGLVGPLMLHYVSPSVVWLAGADLSPWTCFSSYSSYMQHRDTIVVDSCRTGHIPNCFMIRSDDFRRIGGFREIYFIMFEEADLASKVRRDLSLDIVLNFKCQTYHMVPLPVRSGLITRFANIGSTSPLRAYLTNRNRLIYSNYNCSPLQRVFCLFFFAPLILILYLAATLYCRNYKASIAAVNGYLSGLSLSLFSREPTCGKNGLLF